MRPLLKDDCMTRYSSTPTRNPAVTGTRGAAGTALAMIMAIAACLTFLGASEADAQQRGPTSVADIADPLKMAVVNIATTQKLRDAEEVQPPELPQDSPFEEFFQDFFNQEGQGGAQRTSSLGSGFVIDPSGLIVTNNHVIEGADEITAIFTDGSKLKVVKVLGRDQKTDLALLKVEPKEPLPFVEFGNSDTMRVGDWVMAIGNPFGLGGSVTVGVISATRRDIRSGAYDEFLQTDAAINRGNSGGPLFSMDGKVIGVNTAIISPTGGSIGIGFAVPSNSAMLVLEQLKQYGETRRGWLGVRIQTVTDEIAESVGLTSASGALIAAVTEAGPAAKAGIEVGDIIVSFDGKDIVEMRDLPKLVAQTQIDKEVDVVLYRKGERMTVKVKAGKLEESSEAAAEGATEPQPDDRGSLEQPNQKATLGLTFSPITDELRDRYSIAFGMAGVVVTEIDPEGPAASAEIRQGDVVVEVTQQKVASPADIETRLAELQKLNRKNALLTVTSANGEVSFIAVAIQ
jgi:serine protease Do